MPHRLHYICVSLCTKKNIVSFVTLQNPNPKILTKKKAIISNGNTKQHRHTCFRGDVTEIIARIPLRSISKFKSVCKAWKSAIESVYFRRLFVSLHQNTSSCWSLLLLRRRREELLDFHGCKTWGLPKSLGSYIPNVEINGKFKYIGSSNGLVLLHRSSSGTRGTYVGNPVLQQWVEIPYPPNSFTSLCGLVTRVDEDGVVLSFKVVRSGSMSHSQDESYLSFYVYLSETGVWIRKCLFCHLSYPTLFDPLSLNGTLYFPQKDSFNVRPRELVVHDFYGQSKQCKVIPLPDQNLKHNKTALTTSTGFVMYIKTLAQRGGNLLKIWRLNNDSAWQLLWELSLPFIGCYAPVAMHQFYSNIVYLWSQENHYLISCNLQTQNYKIFGDESQHQDCFINLSACEKHMDQISKYGVPLILYQFVLPRWMELMPRPPQVEMINTTSLLSPMHKDEEE